MKSGNITLTQDGKIVTHGEIVGFIEDGKVFLFGNLGSFEIGTYDHRSEVVSIVLDWFNGRR